MQAEITNRKLKACPVLVRHRNGSVEVLVFRHPLAGIQLVKGTVERGEIATQTALRELDEEAGINAASIISDWGRWCSDFEGQIWHFILCEAAELPDSWSHYTGDDGGHVFTFFWHPLEQPPDSQWHEVYGRALQVIRQRLKTDPRWGVAGRNGRS